MHNRKRLRWSSMWLRWIAGMYVQIHALQTSTLLGDKSKIQVQVSLLPKERVWQYWTWTCVESRASMCRVSKIKITAPARNQTIEVLQSEQDWPELWQQRKSPLLITANMITMSNNRLSYRSVSAYIIEQDLLIMYYLLRDVKTLIKKK